MSRSRDEQAAEARYDDDRYGEERYESADERAYGETEADERRFPYLPTWGWPSLGWGTREEYEEGAYEEGTRDERERSRGGGIASLWDESLITLLVVGGVVLFLFPEPATSGLGILMIGLGVLAWIVDWAT